MGNCQSMLSKDQNLIYDRILQNEPLLNLRCNKKALNAVCKGTYAGIRNSYGKFLDKKVSLKQENGGDVCFEVLCSVCFVVY